MTDQNATYVIAVFLVSLVPLVVWGLKVAIEAAITQSIRAEFDSKIEILRSDLRKKEQEISSLRDQIFRDRSKRRELIFTKKISAIDGVWTSFLEVSKFRFACNLFKQIKIEEFSKRAAEDERIRQSLSVFLQVDEKEVLSRIKASNLQPYVPPLIWAIYKAYSTLVINIYGQLRMMEKGIADPIKLVKWDEISDIVREVLPHQAKFIDDHGIGGLAFLLEEIEGKLLKEIREAIDGDGEDDQAIARSVRILESVSKVESRWGEAKKDPI